ncbi:type II secretion system F family protein [Nesterenkonia populi]|uniref:type II secretion system F family protein n=1 Tax=Nesterenkonia populi TaxID=1591087 RepID=UPI0011BE8608|nr:type II secretion system F family protein [Nesterenkonia populi]
MAEIQTFSYTARDAQGKKRRGTMDAGSRSNAISRLQDQGLTVVEVKQSSGSLLTRDIEFSFFQAPSLRDISMAVRQLATMLDAGLTLVRSLRILEEQTENPKLSEVFTAVRRDLERGSSLSVAMKKQTGMFPPLLVHLVESGETGGFLSEALESAADAFDAELKIKDTVKSAMAYPVIVMCIAVLAVIGMLIFIVPIFEEMFEGLGGELPAFTQLLVTISNNMLWIMPIVLLIAGAGWFFWRKYGQDPRVALRVDEFKHKLPVFGKFFRQVAIARFTKTLATTLKAGVPIMQSLTIVKQTAGSPLVQAAVDRVAVGVGNGRSMAVMLEKEEVFPPMVSQLAAVGEDTGALDSMLNQVAIFMDREVQLTAERLTAMVEPLMIVFVGAIIGGMVVALYLPMFSVFGEMM